MRPVFYRFEGGLYYPQQPSTGAWNKSHQNGASFGALLADGLETLPAPRPMQITRLTIDIMRPVPFLPFERRVRVVREGRNMQVVESEIVVDGEVLSRASALRVRIAENPGELEPPQPVLTAEEAPEIPVTRVLGAGWPVETRMVKGAAKEKGPGACWVRLNADLLVGHPLGPVARTVMSADIASGPSSIMAKAEWSYANVDLSIYLTRAPRGEWLLIDSETVTEGNGSALINTVLADADGACGRAHQTLFIAPRS